MTMNTAQRTQSRAKRHPLTLPKWFRPKLDADQVESLRIAHWDNVTAFTNGTADKQILLEWMSSGFTYSHMMQLLAAEGEEFTAEAEQAIAGQLETYPVIVDRYRATGRVGFSPAEYLAAKAAAETIDVLVEMDRHGIALRAVGLSERDMRRVSITSRVEAIA
jgi:hypothetical protein